jgi:hypothetical protein
MVEPVIQQVGKHRIREHKILRRILDGYVVVLWNETPSGIVHRVLNIRVVKYKALGAKVLTTPVNHLLINIDAKVFAQKPLPTECKARQRHCVTPTATADIYDIR